MTSDYVSRRAIVLSTLVFKQSTNLNTLLESVNISTVDIVCGGKNTKPLCFLNRNAIREYIGNLV